MCVRILLYINVIPRLIDGDEIPRCGSVGIGVRVFALHHKAVNVQHFCCLSHHVGRVLVGGCRIPGGDFLNQGANDVLLRGAVPRCHERSVSQ